MAQVKQTTVIQGADKIFNIFVKDPQTGLTVDLTSATNIELVFRNADGTLLTLSVGSGITLITSPQVGLSVVIASAQTTLLYLGCDQTFKLMFTLASRNNIILFKNALNVIIDPLAS